MTMVSVFELSHDTFSTSGCTYLLATGKYLAGLFFISELKYSVSTYRIEKYM